MGYVTMGFASLVTQGSSSGVVTLAVMLFVLFGMSVKDGGKMECFWQEMTLLSVACLITYILRSCNVLSQELPMEKVTDILTFSAMSVILTIVSVVVLWLVHTSNNRNHYRGKLFWGIYRILCVALPVVSVALLAFILANTLLGGKLTSFLTETAGDGGSNWLMFSAAWGSNRGATWSAGARCFWEADLLHKIFGVGPDCMYAFLSNEASPELQNMVYDFFYGNRLTNAHNEWLTILVDIGVLGLVSYAGMMISVIRNFLHAGKKSMLVGACGFCVLAYTVNNMFSFQQVMNISTVFVIMGIGGNLRRSARD